MEKKRIITIGGKPGSGKSSTADAVAEKLGYTRFSSGDFMRQIAQQRGVSIEELNVLAETDQTIDHDIDEAVRSAGDGVELVIDSRLAFHWIPQAFKVYLDLDLQTSAERIFGDASEVRLNSGEVVSSVEALRKSIVRRLASEQKRYRALYDVDPTDISQYDLVINTADHPLPEVADIIVERYQHWLAH